MRLELRKLIVRQPKMVPIHQRFLSEAVNHKPDITPTTLWVRTLVKGTQLYDPREIAKLFGIHRNTVRHKAWICWKLGAGLTGPAA